VPEASTSTESGVKSPATALRKKELADAERERWLARLREPGKS
jgi:hypothetical protein